MRKQDLKIADSGGTMEIEVEDRVFCTSWNESLGV